jgi:sugar porter (SP) family MFS transporter
LKIYGRNSSRNKEQRMIVRASHNRPNRYVILISIVAALSGLLFGFDTAVINGALPFLRLEFQLSDVEVEIVAGILLVGCIAGAASAGWVSDRLGRRRALIVSAIAFALASVASAIPTGLGALCAARFAAGVAIGLASVLGPMYIAEVSPPAIRGRLVSVNQLAIVTGILGAYFINWELANAGAGNWRWMFAAAAVPSVAFWLGLLFIPESPRWLASRGEEGQALRILERIRSELEAGQELREIIQAIERERNWNFAELIRAGLRRPLILAVTLAALGQITGINTIIYYGSLLLREQAGQNASSAIGANVLIGAINLIGTIVAMLTIDRMGRRALLLGGSAAMAISLVVLGLAFHQVHRPFALIVGSILAYVFSFAVSFGPGVWVYISEIFPTAARGKAMSIATMSVWVACLAVTLTFLSIIQALTTAGAFWFFAVLCGIAFLFVWKFLPETMGRSLEEIQAFWTSGNPREIETAQSTRSKEL